MPADVGAGLGDILVGPGDGEVGSRLGTWLGSTVGVDGAGVTVGDGDGKWHNVELSIARLPDSFSRPPDRTRSVEDPSTPTSVASDASSTVTHARDTPGAGPTSTKSLLAGTTFVLQLDLRDHGEHSPVASVHVTPLQSCIIGVGDGVVGKAVGAWLGANVGSLLGCLDETVGDMLGGVHCVPSAVVTFPDTRRDPPETTRTRTCPPSTVPRRCTLDAFAVAVTLRQDDEPSTGGNASTRSCVWGTTLSIQDPGVDQSAEHEKPSSTTATLKAPHECVYRSGVGKGVG